MADTSKYDSVYEVKLAQIAALNGSTGKRYDSVYDTEIEMLRLLEEGGGGGGARIDDQNVSTGTVWSSSKVNSSLGDINASIGSLRSQKANITDVNASLGDYAFVKYITQANYDAEETHQSNALYMIDNEDGKGVQKIYMGANVWHLVNTYDFDSSVSAKQDTLVSGTNIKTINGSSLLGSGDLVIQGGGGSASVVELTQAQYDALATKDPSTIYSITDASVYVMEDYVKNSSWDTLSTTYNPYNTVAARSSNNGYLPNWNERGQINGTSTFLYQRSMTVNGTSIQLYSTNSTTVTGIYAPTSVGTSGQVLQSTGSGVPQWVDFKSDATHYINESDCSQGTYNTSISNFYTECVSVGRILPMQLVNSKIHNVKELDESIDTISADTDFAVENGSTADISYGGNTITINTDGTITDPAGAGIITAQTSFTITGFNIFQTTAAADVSSGDVYSIKSAQHTSYSYYYPSSTRLYEGNIELWFFTTEDGVDWTNLHILIDSDSVTANTSSGSFGS